MTSSDSEADSLSSGITKRKRKSSKKHKDEKKHKKEKKRHKEKRVKFPKPRKIHSTNSDIEAESNTTNMSSIAAPNAREEPNFSEAFVPDAFGPALPPHLLQRQRPVIGPTMPKEFQAQSAAETIATNAEVATGVEGDADESAECDADEGGTFGPMPISHSDTLSAVQIELEERALQLKLAAIDGTKNPTDVEEREEWMLELPEVGLKTGLAALANMKRTFHHGKDKPDFSDRSSWTKTPNSEATTPKASTSKSAAEAMKTTAQEMYERLRDDEQESIAKRHKREHSLVEMHQKKLRKEQRKREKELAAAGVKPERRPFSRDVDLKLNKIDSSQTKQIVDKAKILNTKFASGHTKYL